MSDSECKKSANLSSGGDDIEQTEGEMTNALSAAQLEKLTLEIQSLRSKNRWEDRVARYLPVATVLIAVGGLLFGIIQFQRQQGTQQEASISAQQKDRAAQELDRRSRIQNQTRIDIDQLLQFTSDQQQTISRVLFLLRDLDTLTQGSFITNDEGGVLFLSNNRRTVTNALMKLLHYDCDFLKRPKDVYFATTIFDYWKDYSEYLKQDTKELDFILFKYIRALRDLHDTNPKYFQQLQYDKQSGKYVVLSEADYNEEARFQHFGDTVIGFMKHLSLLDGSPNERESYIQDFQRSLCNADLTEQLFGMNFPYDCSNSKSTYFLRGNRADPPPQLLFPSPIRGSNETNFVTLPDLATFFVILVRLDALGRYESYKATVRSDGGQIVAKRNFLRIQNPNVLSIRLNASDFQSGGFYALAIEGIQTDGQAAVISHYPFRVKRR